jgi:hypothetical protein
VLVVAGAAEAFGAKLAPANAIETSAHITRFIATPPQMSFPPGMMGCVAINRGRQPPIVDGRGVNGAA